MEIEKGKKCAGEKFEDFMELKEEKLWAKDDHGLGDRYGCEVSKMRFPHRENCDSPTRLLHVPRVASLDP